MNRARIGPRSVVVLLWILHGYTELGFSQASDAEALATVRRIMDASLSRCYSTIKGVRRISFEPPTNEEVAEVKALGKKAVAPLAKYLDSPNDFTQLFAVKFLMAIGGPSTLGPLRKAFLQGQWEVTRAAALDGMFKASQADARPYVEAALKDKLQLVRERAQHLWDLYERQSK